VTRLKSAFFICTNCSSTEEEGEEESRMESGRRAVPNHESVSGDHSRKR